ncbi:MAG: aminotransferase class IV [Alphaproteobacteria bacterium]|nr:aminotransferase class IV [Alphaproteobacteria bacterium]
MESKGAQTHVDDPRNAGVLVYINGAMVPRDKAVVSVFDSGFVLGDGIWEGFRQVNGRIAFADAHISRLLDGAKSIDLDIGRTRDELVAALHETCRANGMHDGVHIRLMVTRGPKHTPNQDPRNVIGPATLVIVAEHKVPDPSVKQRGMTLFTSTFRCSTPDVFDLRLNSHSRLNLIQALLQAIRAGANEALMLDPHGFVASCNSTNFFIVKDGVVRTSTGRFNFCGITRANVLAVARANAIPVEETDFTLAETYAADEAFVTGTFGGVTPVSTIDGRRIGAGALPGPVSQRLGELYSELLRRPDHAR